MEPPIIELKNVYKRFGQKVVLDGVDLSIEKGHTTVIIGKSGAGKSVLLKCIAGLMDVDAGKIFFDGQDLNALSRRARREKIKRLSYMFQNNALFDSLTAFDNIALPLRENTRLPDHEIEQKVSAILEKIDLADIGDKFPSELSGGMQKRVALARALITVPDIVLFDEPTAGLDPIRRNTVFGMIEQYQELFNFTAVVVTHELPDALYVADEVAVLDESKVAFQGTPLEFEQSNTILSQTFLESGEALKHMMMGLEEQSELNRRFADIGARAEGWLLVRLESYARLYQGMGKVTVQSVLAVMVEAICGKEKEVFAGSHFAVREDTVLIALDKFLVTEALLVEALSTAFDQEKREHAFAYDGTSLEVAVSCSFKRNHQDGKLSELLSMLESELKVAYELKHFESKEIV